MSKKRMLLDALIVVVAVGLLASPYLITHPRVSPFVPQGHLVASPPCFGLKTNEGRIFVTVTLMLSNAGPIDLDCRVDWFDCRATNNLTENELFAGLAGVQILKSGVVTQFSAIALSSTNALSAHVCCYGIRWRGVPSKLALGVTGVPVLRRLFLQNNGVLWRLGALLRKHELEESWCFASNVGIPEYFLLLGVDASGLRRLMAESSHNEVALSKARWEQELLRVRAGRSLGTELEAADQTVKVAEAAVQRSQLDEVWNAYKIWLEHNARIPAEPGGPANQSQPVRPETSRVSPAAGSGR